MKALKMLAVAALVIAPATAVAVPASAAVPTEAGSSLVYGSGSVSTPAGWGADFSAWMCRNYGIACG